MQSDKAISVIIPVHNWDISLLVDALGREIVSGNLSNEVEVIIADDCSSSEYKEKNRKAVSAKPFCSYFELEVQKGRSGIRNFLIEKASNPNVLLLDADMLPDRGEFLTVYRQQITSDQRVICGGYSYATRILEGREYDFYVYKGKKTEEIAASIRNKTPWRYLFTGNVLVPRVVLETIDFDERFTGYGYEDIEWGIRLSARYPIIHIENTCSHLGLVKKEDAFERMRSSISNFKKLEQLHPELFAMTGAGRVARLCSILPKALLRGLDTIVAGFFSRSEGDAFCYYLFQLDKAVLLALADDWKSGKNE